VRGEGFMPEADKIKPATHNPFAGLKDKLKNR